MGDNLSVYYFGHLHPINESLIVSPPRGIDFKSNVSKEDFADYIKPPEYNRQRRFIINSLDKAYSALKIPRMTPILHNCDVVHTNGGVVPLTNKPWILSIEYISSLYSWNNGWIDSNYMKKNIIKILKSKRCRWILPYSEASLESIELALGSEYCAIAEKTKVLYPAISANKEIGVKRNDSPSIKILFIGNRFFDKGGRELYYSFKKLEQKYDLELYLVTTAPEHHSDLFQAFKKKIDKEPKVHLMSNVPRSVINELYDKSDIFCFPSYMETFGYVLLEAMANRMAIISSDQFAIPEIIDNNKTGILVHAPFTSFTRGELRSDVTVARYRDIVLNEYCFKTVVEELQIALENLILNDSVRKKLANNAYNEARNGKFSVSVRNEKLKRLYLDCED